MYGSGSGSPAVVLSTESVVSGARDVDSTYRVTTYTWCGYPLWGGSLLDLARGLGFDFDTSLDLVQSLALDSRLGRQPGLNGG